MSPGPICIANLSVALLNIVLVIAMNIAMVAHIPPPPHAWDRVVLVVWIGAMLATWWVTYRAVSAWSV